MCGGHHTAFGLPPGGRSSACSSPRPAEAGASSPEDNRHSPTSMSNVGTTTHRPPRESRDMHPYGAGGSDGEAAGTSPVGVNAPYSTHPPRHQAPSSPSCVSVRRCRVRPLTSSTRSFGRCMARRGRTARSPSGTVRTRVHLLHWRFHPVPGRYRRLGQMALERILEVKLLVVKLTGTEACGGASAAATPPTRYRPRTPCTRTAYFFSKSTRETS
jgi:hypothetical protein